MKRNITAYIAAVLIAAVTITAAGCSDEPAESQGAPVALTSLGVNDITAQAGIPEDDPTTAGMAARVDAGHRMAVTLDGQSAGYIFDDGKWVAETAALPFNGYGKSSLELALGKSGTVAQDGTREKLLDSDALEYESAEITPAEHLSGIAMTHARSLLEMTFDEKFTEPITNLTVGDGIIPYNAPSSKRYLAVIEPGTTTLNIKGTHDGVNLEYRITEADLADGGFLANNRYKVTFTILGNSLVIRAIHVESWTDKGTGVAKPSLTNTFIFPNFTVVKPFKATFLSGYEKEAEVVSGTVNKYTVPGAKGDVIKSISFPDDPLKRVYMIGRVSGSEITLDITPAISDGQVLAYPLKLREVGGKAQINTVEELKMVDDSNENHAKSYLQTSDLDLMDLTWDPLCPARYFTGTYDGGGFGIANLNAKGSNKALFSNNDGTMRNITITSGHLDGGTTSQGNAGIVSNNYRLIENCTNYANVSGQTAIGGICAASTKGEIKGCTNYGDVISRAVVNNGWAGGIVGFVGNAMNPEDISISNCRNYGNIIAPSKVGGIVGIGYSITRISSCTNEGDIASLSGERSGGIGGEIVGSIVDCSNKGNISCSSYYCGGVVGLFMGTLSNCHNEGNVEAYAHVGGVGGTNVGGVTESCTNKGEIFGRSADTWEESITGGILGSNNTGQLRNCINYGKVRGRDYVGGIIAFATYDENRVEACVNYGEVISTTQYAGGIVAEIRQGIVTACINHGNVTAPRIAGGLAANVWDAGTLRASYSLGAVTATQTVGGVAGTNKPGAHILYNYWAGTLDNVIGVDNATDPATQTIAWKFSASNWPADDSGKGWGTGNDYAAGKYWNSLGQYSATAPSYPQLYWIANQ